MTCPTPKTSDPSTTSLLMRLPTELRLQIYCLLVLPTHSTDLYPSFEKVHSSTQDYFDYDKKSHGTDLPLTPNLANPTLLIRTIDPDRYRARYVAMITRPAPTRSKYSVRCDRFRSACKSTTYHCVNIPRIEANLGVLRVSKQMHCEVTECLYSSYTFDFDTHVEAIVPFFQDLTPWARSCVKSIRVVKRALAYEKEFDRCEWTAALQYLTSPDSGISLKRLDLGIVAGRPGERGWDGVETYAARDFASIKGMAGMEWMREVLEIKGLKELKVEAVVEHCPTGGNSSAMADYIRFSASVDGGFKEYMTNQMVGCIQARTQFYDATKEPTLKGKRLGVLREAFGTHEGIVQVLNTALDGLKNAGAELIDIEIPDLDYYKTFTSVHSTRSQSDINTFLASRLPSSHLKIEALQKDGIYRKSLDLIDVLVEAPDDYTTDPHFAKRLVEQSKFQRIVASIFAKLKLDAMIYPTCQLLASKTQDLLDMRWTCLNYPTNTVIASQLLFPAISVPIGKTKNLGEDPDGPELPVGLEILGLPLGEERLLAVAEGVESVRQAHT